METEWNGKDNKVFIWSDLDFDLTERVLHGFCQETNAMEMANCRLLYTDCEDGLKAAMSIGCPVVCMGYRWNGKWTGPEIIKNGTNGFYTDNLDECRWIIKRLMEKTPEELKGMSRKAMETYNEKWGQNENK